MVDSPPINSGAHGLIKGKGDEVIIATYTIFSALGLVLTHLIIITKFRLWHTNPILEKIPQIVNNPISQILSQGIGLIAVVNYRNDLYLIWLVILLIAYDNVFTITGCTLIEKGADRMSREYLFFTNCVFIGALVSSYNDKTVYYRPLLTLWSLVIVKFIVRLISYKVAEKAYGIKNTNLVADYMETEHKLSDYTPNPQTMRGYKYLVIGEEMADPVITAPLYTLEFKKSEDKVVTVEQVWECQKGLLDSTIDKNERIKDVCLSFALFKLIRRRFFGFRAAESQQPKTKKFVFDGLLSRDSEDIFRVISMELGFLRDFFYTRYPVAFAFGFPLINVIVLVVMFATSLWISAKAFHARKEPDNKYWIVHKQNIDYHITNGLLVVIMVMEIFEVLTYVFSDWMKVITICKHVRSKTKKIPFIDEILNLFCKPKLSNSLNNTIGQYSLLKSYNKGTFKMLGNNCLYHATCAMLASKIPRGMQKDKAIVLPLEVKAAILDVLKVSDGNFTDGLASLNRNGVTGDFSWLGNLRTPLHAIMVWHIATSLCEIHPIISEIRPAINQPIMNNTKSWFGFFTKCLGNCLTTLCKICPTIDQPDDTNCSFGCFSKCLPSRLFKIETPEKQAIKSPCLVASSLSKYCAYLVVFVPELLPTSTYSAKRIFDKIVSETSEFFETTNGPNEQYELIMEYNKKNDGGKRIKKDDKLKQIISMGSRLASNMGARLVSNTGKGKGQQVIDMSDEKGDLVIDVVEEKNHMVIAMGGEKGDQNSDIGAKVSSSIKKDDEDKQIREDDEPQQIIDMGARLARYLVNEIPDDIKRWKVMADVWSELILSLAPSGYTSGHLGKLATGGEFITHLWALLYHAGIVGNTSEESGA